jgi:hypothetical protein
MLNDLLEAYDIVEMKKSDVEKARKLVAENFGKLMRLWERCNG